MNTNKNKRKYEWKEWRGIDGGDFDRGYDCTFENNVIGYVQSNENNHHWIDDTKHI